MKIFALLASLTLLTQAHASTVWWALTNWTFTTITNATIVTPVGQPLADGTYLVTGLPVRFPPTNSVVGTWTNVLHFGNYRLDIEGLTLQHPIFFQVPNDNNTYNIVDLLISGGNFFGLTGVRRVTSADGSLSLNPANGVGVVDLSSTGAGDARYILRSNGFGTNTTFSGTFAVGTGAPDVVGTYAWSFSDTVTRGGPSLSFLDIENRSDPTATNDAYFLFSPLTTGGSNPARAHFQMGAYMNGNPAQGELFDLFDQAKAGGVGYTWWWSNGVRVVGMWHSNNVWTASGFLDNSGTPGSLIGYGSGGILNNRLIGVNLSGDITTSGGTATTLKNTGTAGTYTKITFDAQGRETSGTTLSVSDLPNTGTAGTYRSVTFNAQGLETSGSNPTTFAGYAISDSSADLFAALTDWNAYNWTNLLAQNIVAYTNSLPNGNNVDFSLRVATTNMSGNITWTGLVNNNPTNYNWVIRHCVNTSGGNLTVSGGTGWRLDIGAGNSYTVTNGTCRDFWIEQQTSQFTNMFSVTAY